MLPVPEYSSAFYMEILYQLAAANTSYVFKSYMTIIAVMVNVSLLCTDLDVIQKEATIRCRPCRL